MVNFHRTLLIIFGIPTGYLVYLTFLPEPVSMSWLLIPLSVIISAIIVMRHQIDAWWLHKQPPEMDDVLLRILIDKVVDYRMIFANGFHSPVDHHIYTSKCDFTGQSIEDIPDDIKHIITAHAYFFGTNEHKNWPHHYDRVVLYKHPFLSPQNDSEVHTVEHHKEDGVMVFSLEQGLNGIEHKGRFYNIFLHGYAEAFLDLYPVHHHLDDDTILDRLNQFSPKAYAHARAVVGLKQLNLLALVAHFYCYNPRHIGALFPELRLALFANMNVYVD